MSRACCLGSLAEPTAQFVIRIEFRPVESYAGYFTGPSQPVERRSADPKCTGCIPGSHCKGNSRRRCRASAQLIIHRTFLSKRPRKCGCWCRVSPKPGRPRRSNPMSRAALGHLIWVCISAMPCLGWCTLPRTGRLVVHPPDETARSATIALAMAIPITRCSQTDQQHALRQLPIAPTSLRGRRLGLNPPPQPHPCSPYMTSQASCRAAS